MDKKTAALATALLATGYGLGQVDLAPAAIAQTVERTVGAPVPRGSDYCEAFPQSALDLLCARFEAHGLPDSACKAEALAFMEMTPTPNDPANCGQVAARFRVQGKMELE